MTLFPESLRKRTLSSIIARLSSRGMPRACVTWKSHDFPNMQHHPTGAAASALRLGSSCGRDPCLRVLPKATSSVVARSISAALAKNSSSLGLEPGHPPSTKSKPVVSSLFRTSSLSSQENETPSVWAPSLRVVS